MEIKKGSKAVFGIYSSRYAVDAAVDRFKERGFRNQDISVLMPSKEGTQDFAHKKDTKAPEGATTGAATGAVLGGGLGWLVGIGALAIPGIGPFVAAGPIMAALAGAGVGGTVGGLTGALIGMGIPEYEAKRFEGMVKDGGILLSVHVDDSDWQKKAKELMQETGARDIATAGEESSKGDSKPGMKTDPSHTYSADRPFPADGTYGSDTGFGKASKPVKDDRKTFGI